MGKKRIEELDIIKALAIICMVLGHSGFWGTGFVFLFHMAVFFIASGCTYSSRSSDSTGNVIDFIRKKIVRLWFPFFFWRTLWTLLNNWFIRVNILTDNPELLEYTKSMKIMNLNSQPPAVHMMSVREMLVNIVNSAFFRGFSKVGGALWFLGTLFFVSVSFCIADYLIKKIFRRDPLFFQVVISVILLGFSYYCHITGFGLDALARLSCSYYLFFLGTVLMRFRNRFAQIGRGKMLAAFAVSFVILIIMDAMGHHKIQITIGSNFYPNPLFFAAASVCGWVFLYSISYFLKNTPLKKPLTVIGSCTMGILALHYLSFKIVCAIVVKVYGLPSFCIAARPHLYGDTGLWWLAYTVVGVTVPVLLNMLYRRVKKGLIASAGRN